MRKRSESFYAKTGEEFDSEAQAKEERRSRVASFLDDEEEDDTLGFKIKPQRRYSNQTEKKFSSLDDLDNLGVEKSFTFTQIPPTLEEDEFSLMENIKKMNSSYKAKDKNAFIDEITNIYRYILKEKKSQELNEDLNTSKMSKEKKGGEEIKKGGTHKKFSRSLTFDNLENMNINYDILKSIEEMAFSEETTYNSYKSVLCDPIVSKNINVIDDVLKLMFIGDQTVGKSFMIQKLIEERSENGSDLNLNNYPYFPTTSLEIKKKKINMLGKNVCLELWDTNTHIANSEIVHVYYKICDGFFLIFDPLKAESINFIDKQLQSIIKFSSNPNFFLIANMKFLDSDFDKLKEHHKKFVETDSLIKQLLKKYDLKIYYINIDSLKLFKHNIKKFLSLTFIKKGMYNLKLNNASNQKRKNNTLVKSKNDRRSLNYILYSEEENILGKYIILICLTFRKLIFVFKCYTFS